MGVHAVHGVLGVCALGRGHGLDASGDLTIGFPLVQQRFDVLVLGVVVLLIGLQEVAELRAELLEFVLKRATLHGHFARRDASPNV